MGAVQAVGAAAIVWGSTASDRNAMTWRTLAGFVLAAATVLRTWRPVEGGVILCLVQAAALLRLMRLTPPRMGRAAAVLLAGLPMVATHGPWAYAADHGRRSTDWSLFAFPAAGLLLAAGTLLAADVWRRRLAHAMPETPAAAAKLRRDLRRGLVVLIAWLAGGMLLAVWYGRHARQAFEENLLRRMETAVLAVDQEVLVEAFSPALRVEGLQPRKYADGTPVVVALTPRTTDPVYAKLRKQLIRIREQNPDFHLFYVTTWRQGYLLEFASERRDSEPDARVINRQVSSADLIRLADRKSFLEGPHRRRWGPAFSAQAPLLHPTTGRAIGWLVADIEATRWSVTFTQARLQTMALVGAGVGLWALAVAYRLRRESRDAAEQKAAAAAAADRMKSAFLAKVSHELRTPIQSVLGYGELLTHAPLSDSHRTWLNALRSHGDIMLRLVNDLIDLGALQSGAFQLENAPVRLRKLIDDCVASLRPAAADRGLVLRVEISHEVPEWVTTDSVRLRQILLNLLTNSVKFTPAGSVTMTVKRTADLRVEFVVADSGPGIPHALRARLFQPFTRLDPASGGSGLGLALVHGLCTAMGGNVALSDATEGAVFTVTLPLPEQQPTVGGKTTAPDGQKFSGLRVLVAEDNTLVRELLVAFLAENGAEVLAACDGPAAVTLVREQVPDVLLLDIALPGLDGIAVAKTLRAEHGSLVRIIGLSAHAGPADEARARAAGMDAFFTKPVSLAALAETLAPRTGTSPRVVELAPRIADERLRARLLADFTRETPRLLEEMQVALTARDWPRLRSRAHYLKNSADILGASALQAACDRLATFDDTEHLHSVRLMLEAVSAAIPESALTSAEASAADLV
jgi:signal transduction histidine kinase/DNA-binding NarL/FixJ family response regulator